MSAQYLLKEFFTIDQPLGDVQAVHGLNDREVFRRYFHQANRPFEQVKSHPTMIVGRRGSGKTDALLSHRFVPHRIGNYDPLVYFDAERAARTFQTILVRINDQIRVDEPKPMVEQVAALWSYVLWLSVFQQIASVDDDEPSVVQIREFVRAHDLDIINLDPYEAALRGLSTLILKYESLPEKEKLFGFFQRFDRLDLCDISFTEAKDATHRYLMRNSKRGIILFDSFEQLNVTQEETRLTLSGLLRGISQFTGSSTMVDIRCCIPAEAFFYLTELSSNVLKDFQRHTVLHWSAMEILQLCAKRYAAFLELHHGRTVQDLTGNVSALETRDGTIAFWEHFLPKEVPNTHPGIMEPTIPYLLRHTQLLPRQMILMLNKCFSDHFGSGLTIDDKLRPKSISAAVKETEARIYNEIISAHQFIWPSAIEQVPQVLKRIGSNVCRYGDMHRAFNQSSVKGYGNVFEFEDFLRMLTEIGGVGRLIQRNRNYIKAQFEYSEPFRLLFNDTDELCIHPCFTRVARVITEATAPPSYCPVYPLGAQLDDPDRRDL
ncbi:MAG: hypothetical protein KJ871_04420 [Alphaproteobacteria bacterium]|nr:hypothetical protein [Alphaproteobacteria bacterium]MBU2083947.1 hypothetical protein [Alphaproteobacteria bacterium]MBU2142299.1 hypothetical protein [Alphaproteobacteria bacterium]MBU2196497.1 hypothetical protein [Alphaproteobacteria bacterium]